MIFERSVRERLHRGNVVVGELLYVAHRLRRAIIVAVPTLGAVMMVAVAQHYHLLP